MECVVFESHSSIILRRVMLPASAGPRILAGDSAMGLGHLQFIQPGPRPMAPRLNTRTPARRPAQTVAASLTVSGNHDNRRARDGASLPGGTQPAGCGMESSKRGAGWTTWSFYFIRSPGPLTAYCGLLAAISRSLASELGLNFGTVPEADMFPMSTQHVIDLKNK